MPDREFTGHTAFITGAGAGIGRATALAFARAGANLILGDLNEDALTETQTLAESLGALTVAKITNVANEPEVAALLAAGLEVFPRLDHAFNNAGITTYVETWDLSEIEKVMAVNFNGVVYGMKHQIGQFQAQGTPGTIVNTASIAGLSGAGTAEYCASKHAVIGLTRSAGVRNAPLGIRINAVCPGVIETSMTAPLLANDAIRPMILQMCPIGRVGRPEEIADAVLFLSSPRASFIIGHALPVDGGYMAS